MTKIHKIALGVAVLALISLTAAFALNGSTGKGISTTIDTNEATTACGCFFHQAKETKPADCPKDDGTKDCCCKDDCQCCDGCKDGNCTCEDCKCCDCCKGKAVCKCCEECKCCDGCKGGECTCEDCDCCDCCKK